MFSPGNIQIYLVNIVFLPRAALVTQKSKALDVKVLDVEKFTTFWLKKILKNSMHWSVFSC